MKEQLIEFLKPDRNKIVVALLFPYLFFLFGIFLYGITYLLDMPIDMPFSEYIHIDLSFIVRGFGQTVLFYPFVCALFITVRLYRKGGFKEILADKWMLLLISLGILIFNPISSYFLLVMTNLLLISLKSPPIPMVEVVEISLDTHLANSSLRVGDKVYEIDISKFEGEIIEKRNNITYVTPNVTNKGTFKIRNSSDFYNALNVAKSEDWILFTAIRGTFSLQIKENITDWGIKVKDIEYKQWL